MKCFLFIVAIVFTHMAFAETTTVPVTDRPWVIIFDTPGQLQHESKSKGEYFQYTGHTSGGFNVSVFVEPILGNGGSHKAVKAHYWPQMMKNPRIDPSSVMPMDQENHSSVKYIIEAEKDGVRHRIPNLNLFIEHEGAWIDVHVSKYPWNKEDFLLFYDFQNSLKFVKKK